MKYSTFIFAIVFVLLAAPYSKAIDYCKAYEVFKMESLDKKMLEEALIFHKTFSKKHNLNSKQILLTDYSINSSKARFFILDLKKGEVKKLKVSHGSGKITLYKKTEMGIDDYVERLNGENGHNGSFTKCRIPDEDLVRINSNRSDAGFPPKHNQENLTRAGFFKIANRYFSIKHKEGTQSSTVFWPYIDENSNNGIRLIGLSEGVNEMALEHGVVMHEASYNSQYAPVMGRSYGCPAFVPGDLKNHLGYFSQGTLYYSFVPQCADEMTKATSILPKISLCKNKEQISN